MYFNPLPLSFFEEKIYFVLAWPKISEEYMYLICSFVLAASQRVFRSDEVSRRERTCSFSPNGQEGLTLSDASRWPTSSLHGFSFGRAGQVHRPAARLSKDPRTIQVESNLSL